MACWKVGTELLWGSEFGSVDECCGAAEVLIAETEVPAKRRRTPRELQKRLWHGLPAPRKEKKEV